MSPALQAVHRATQRSAASVHLDLKHGLSALSTIATLAPFIGLLATLAGIVNAFKGNNEGKFFSFAPIAGGISEALVSTAFGLLVGIVALVCHRYLSSNLSELDHEMELAGRNLLQHLHHVSPGFQAPTAVEERPLFGAKSARELDLDEKCFRMCRWVSTISFLAAWYLQATYFLSLGSLNAFDACVFASNVHVALIAASCCIAYPVWVKILNRQRGALLALSSVLALSWAMVETIHHLYK